MSNDSYGDGNVYRGQRSRDSAVKTITLAQPEQCRKEKHENGEYVCNCKAGECPQFAQPEQEPVVGTKTWFEDGKVVTQYLYPSDIYTTPPQRTWVGLTDEEVEEIERWVEFKEEGSGRIPTAKLVRYIETKLKEKTRTWVGLSTDEFKFIASKYLLSREAGLEYFQEEIEAKLKEKNI